MSAITLQDQLYDQSHLPRDILAHRPQSDTPGTPGPRLPAGTEQPSGMHPAVIIAAMEGSIWFLLVFWVVPAGFGYMVATLIYGVNLAEGLQAPMNMFRSLDEHPSAEVEAVATTQLRHTLLECVARSHEGACDCLGTDGCLTRVQGHQVSPVRARGIANCRLCCGADVLLPDLRQRMRRPHRMRMSPLSRWLCQSWLAPVPLQRFGA